MFSHILKVAAVALAIQSGVLAQERTADSLLQLQVTKSMTLLEESDAYAPTPTTATPAKKYYSPPRKSRKPYRPAPKYYDDDYEDDEDDYETDYVSKYNYNLRGYYAQKPKYGPAPTAAPRTTAPPPAPRDSCGGPRYKCSDDRTQVLVCQAQDSRATTYAYVPNGAPCAAANQFCATINGHPYCLPKPK